MRGIVASPSSCDKRRCDATQVTIRCLAGALLGHRRARRALHTSDRSQSRGGGGALLRARSADPDYERARNATQESGHGELLKLKAGHWTRILGHGGPLTQLNARVVTQYISTRRRVSVDEAGKKPVSDSTIGKELVS